MPYSTTAVQMLISCPSDVPRPELAVIRRTIDQWNFTYGRGFGVTVQPVSWDQHAMPEFGPRPQEILNRQLVDVADMVLAIFGTRLGSPTGTDESGTAEEIRRTAEAQKPVGVLRNVGMPIPKSPEDVEQLKKLTEYLDSLMTTALVKEYQNESELVAVIYQFLPFAATRYVDRAAAADEQTVDEAGWGVWPRVEVSEQIRYDSKGRPKTSRSRKLMLRNTFPRPVHNVRARLESEDGEDIDNLMVLRAQESSIEILGPGQDIEFGFIAFGMGMRQQARCVVSYQEQGVEQETIATVRA